MLAKGVTAVLAVACALQVLCAVVGLPPGLGEWITARDWPGAGPPRFVVVLGGAGIPSASGLMRTYHAAHLARSVTGAVYVVCLPSDTDPETSSVGRMRDELVLRGIPAESVLMEHDGRNTHEQAVSVKRLLGDEALGESVLIVSSPVHMRRALMSFRKVGFERLSTAPARPEGVEADLGPGTGVRYAFWANLERNVQVVRELVALAYYKLRGWV
jgi:uncharacterized SAM-binding protein YcdF (DUF218 family)